MDVSKYRALFIDESREHLSDMSRLLVELESAKERAPVIDEIFRHAHSIKSMAASMGYEPIGTLAHRLEDVVGALRTRGLTPSAEAVDVLLRGVDALGQQVASIAEGSPLQGYFDLVRELGAATHAIAEAPAPPAPVVEAAAPRSGASSPVVRVHLAVGCPSPPLRAFLIYRRLSELGPIVTVEPSLEQMKSGQMRGLQVRFVFAQAREAYAVQEHLAHVPDIERIELELVEGATSPSADVAPREPPAATAPPEPVEFKTLATVRVRTDLLDDIMDSVGELFIVRERLRVLLAGREEAELRGVLDSFGGRIRQIHDQVIAARMMPLRTLTDRYPRLVRDLCRTLGKEVELEVRGRDIEVDRAVLENLDVPFIHTLRNAVDHGIELPADRARRHKSAAGRIVIHALRERDSVLVTIEDDGAGLDPERLRQAAVSRGVITESAAANLSQRETFFLICLPGFSTKSEISNISGRGVGMDVVAAQVDGVGGGLDIESDLGRGTRFIFRLPLTLAIIPVLLVRAAERLFAVPVGKVVAVRDTAGDTLMQPDGSRYLRFRDGLLRVMPLTSLLGLATAPAAAVPAQVVVVEAGAEHYALGVDAVVGYREVVVKPLGDPLDRLEWFSGATILGDGQPILILDLPKTLRAKVAA